jgi:hypothetical protein
MEVLDMIMKANEFSWRLEEENIFMPQSTHEEK